MTQNPRGTVPTAVLLEQEVHHVQWAAFFCLFWWEIIAANLTQKVVVAGVYQALNSIIPKSGNYSQGTSGSVFLLDYCKLTVSLSDLTSECKSFSSFLGVPKKSVFR